MTSADAGYTIPPGLKLRQVLRGHTDTIVRALWMSGGEGLASASVENIVRFWELEKGEQYHQVVGQAHGFTNFAISPDGQYLITTSWNDGNLEVWHVASGSRVMMLKGHTAAVNTVIFMPDGRHAISGSDDETIIVWSLENAKPIMTLSGHRNFVWALVLRQDGRYLISASADATIKVWDLQSGEDVRTLKCPNWVTAIALAPDGQTLASGCDDGMLYQWNLLSGQMTRQLMGHEGVITSIGFSHDGRLFGSKSMDDTVRLWRCDNWEQVAVLPEPVYRGRGYYPNGLAFHPSAALLATLGERDKVIRVWKLDYTVLFSNQNRVRGYATVKIALIGENGVGKSGLGYRLAHGKSSESFATRRYQTWSVDALSGSRADGTVCDAILWDFAGQPDHRLIHALFLDDVDIALLLFDPTNWRDPLKGVEYWTKQLAQRPDGGKCRIILVGARLDYGAATLTQQELADFCRHHGISGGYVGTSALTGQGIDELMEAIKRQLDWESVTNTVSLMLFQRIKEYLLSLKADAETRRLLLTLPEVRVHLERQDEGWEFSDDELLIALRHLQNHGHISLIPGANEEIAILLEPERLIDITSSILAEARGNPRGLGTLEEVKLENGDYHFEELDGLTPYEGGILLAAAMDLLDRHAFYFRETFEPYRLLIFPNVINQKRPLTIAADVEEDVSYRIRGAVDNLYAALVVLLNYTPVFRRSYQWDDHAQFEMGIGEICGFRQERLRENEIELVLYYGKGTPEFTRAIFYGLFERCLNSRSNVQIVRFPAVSCAACRYRLNRKDVVKLMALGRTHFYCPACGHANPLRPPTAGLANRPAPRSPTSRDRQQTHFLNALTKIKEVFLRDHRKPATCFISYAWGNATHEYWVRRLVDHLHDAGIEVTIDAWDNPDVGGSVEPLVRKIAASEFILVVGTPQYKQKYENKHVQMGSVVNQEIELINRRLNGTEAEKRTVLPLLLEGNESEAFPEPLRGRLFIAFQEERFYFVSLFNLILTLYRIPSQDPIVGDLRKIMRENSG